MVQEEKVFEFYLQLFCKFEIVPRQKKKKKYTKYKELKMILQIG